MGRRKTIEKSNILCFSAESSRKKKKKPISDPQLAAKCILFSTISEFNYKTAHSASNAANFGTMAKIVDYMKKRHLSAQHWSLSLPEILEELQIYDLGKKTEAWLQEACSFESFKFKNRKALPSNPRLMVDENGKFLFKPPYKVRGKNSLLMLLKKYHLEGKGGILLSDLNECVPAADKHVEALGNAVIDVLTVINKRKDHVYFFNDTETDYAFIHYSLKAFKSLWRNASVDHLDEKKIEEYLQKHGIDAVKNVAPSKKIFAPPKRKIAKRRVNQKVHNEHLADLLVDYE
ncbi:unnamed protein product [Dracunculus medinensis]|uniref:Transcription initiation factor IIE subunit beta n=1 Tax=Dracunculus medinensis TaxID=318479 RepID=A0A0N4U2K1_DRAME|nr:unnamed protein product [Dracunculus medinensis]